MKSEEEIVDELIRIQEFVFGKDKQLAENAKSYSMGLRYVLGEKFRKPPSAYFEEKAQKVEK